jgi:hypothetical protein
MPTPRTLRESELCLVTTSAQVPDPVAPERLPEDLHALRSARARRHRAIAIAILLALIPPFLITPAFSRARRVSAHARERATPKRPPLIERLVVDQVLPALPGQ